MAQRLDVTLTEFIQASGYSIGQVARLSGVPRRSVANWATGRSRRPRHVEDVLKIARVVRLNAKDLDVLLESAEMGTTLATLLATSEQDKQLHQLLEPWHESAESPAPTLSTPTKYVPFQAIREIPYFVGRKLEIDQLLERLRQPQQASCVIQGMGGVGKSSLAAHLAYRLREEFEDGVLWAKVDQSNTMAILHSFAAAFGRDVSDYTDLTSRSRVVREILADKRVLIILDDVADDETLELLLPPTSDGCGVIVTTRRADLSSMLGAYWHRLRPFSAESTESLDLFAEIAGQLRVLAERETFEQLAELLGHLPLAIAIAAARLVSDPTMTAQSLLLQLGSADSTVRQLSFGKDSLTRTFDLGVSWLSAEEQLFFTTLGAFSNDDIIVEAVADVNAIPSQRANEILQKLYRLSMVQSGSVGHFKLHPLIYDYANARGQGDKMLLEAMVLQMVTHVEANQLNYLYIDRILNQIQRALKQAEELALDDLFLRGVYALFPHMSDTGQLDLAESYLEKASLVALYSLDPKDEARTIWASGIISQKRGKNPKAIKQFNQALRIAKSEPDSILFCDIHDSMGHALIRTGELDKATEVLKIGLAQADAIEYRVGKCRMLTRLGDMERGRGDFDQAELYEKQALRLARTLNRNDLLSQTLTSSGVTAAQRGNYDKAERLFVESLRLAEEMGSYEKSCGYLINLATLYKLRGNMAQAQMLSRQALGIARDIGHQELQAFILLTRGQLLSTVGNLTGAAEQLEECQRISIELQNTSILMTLVGHLISVYRERGLYEKAEDTFLVAQANWPADSHAFERCEMYCQLSRLYYDMGEPNKAFATIDHGLGLAHELGFPLEVATLNLQRAQLYIQIGKLDAAADMLAKVAEATEEVDSQLLLGNLRLAEGEWQLAQDAWQQAQAVFEDALAIGESQPHYEIQASALFGLARAYYGMGQQEQGIEFGRMSHDKFAQAGYAKTSQLDSWLAQISIDVD